VTQVNKAVQNDTSGERKSVIAGARETESARNCMSFHEVYRKFFGVLTIHMDASFATVLQMKKN
jgi:hypothetical protein